MSVRVFTSSRVRQNTSVAVGASMSRMRTSAAVLWARATTYAVWRTAGASPWAIGTRSLSMRTGLLRCLLAMELIRLGKVAENSTVCRLDGVASRIVSRSS
ncbi:unannotated protein [freshwater metagenome]|uniref:Unannotated protein n=1 Tax=freshwater metagenome TaxID=449393 RepID=A0A6J7KFN2_9ZZZZ